MFSPIFTINNSIIKNISLIEAAKAIIEDAPLIPAYEKQFRGGIKVAVTNIEGRQNHNKSKIIVAPGPGRNSQIKIFDNRAVLEKQFLAYGRNWLGGVNLAAGDINNDGIGEIVVGAEPGAAPHVRIFDGRGILLESFYAWEESWNGGANIAIINIAN